MKSFVFSLICFCLIFSVITRAEIPKSITLAAADWCPYTCPSKEEPGIVVEYFRNILAPYGITLDIRYLPWNRAIREVNIGSVAGLTTAVPSEAPDLQFTSVATMDYSVCLYSRESSNWQYSEPSSLKGNILGAALNYSYGESIDAYINENIDNGAITFIAGDKKIFRYASMLRSNRIDAFIGDMYVTGWGAKNENIDMQQIKINHCLQKTPFYMALNPELLWSKELINLLDQELSKEENSEILSEIIYRYTAQ